MKKSIWNILFLSILILLNTFCSVQSTKNHIRGMSLQSNKSEDPEIKQKVVSNNKSIPSKKYIKIKEKGMDGVLKSFYNISKKYPNQYFMIIFSTEDGQFPIDFLSKKTKFNVYRYNVKSDSHFNHIYVIKNGKPEEDKKIDINSKENKNYSDFLQKKYQLRRAEMQDDNSSSEDGSEKLKMKRTISLLGLKDSNEEQSNEVDEKGEKKGKDKRLIRFIWAIFLVLIFSISLFFLVKSSIDWATNGKNEINKAKEQKLREVTEVIFNKDF